MRSVVFAAVAATVLPAMLAAAGCSGAPGGDSGGGDLFVAFPSSFQPFRTWPAYHSDGPAPGTVPDAVLGERTQFISKVPPAAATEFPIGTMIVEARANGLIFAASKRGGGFNASG